MVFLIEYKPRSYNSGKRQKIILRLNLAFKVDCTFHEDASQILAREIILKKNEMIV